MSIIWRILDWVYSKDDSLVSIDENQNYHIEWEEVQVLPEFALGKLRCKLFNRHGLPFFGVCIYCGKELQPRDYVGWFEKYDPEHNDMHSFMKDPFQILLGIIQIGFYAKRQKSHEDADILFKEAHK